MAAAKRSPRNPEEPKVPQRRNQARAATQATVQTLKVKLEEMQNLFYQVRPQEITPLNISNLQNDISNMLQVVQNLKKVPEIHEYFNGIDRFENCLLQIQVLLATQFDLFTITRRSRRTIQDFYRAYPELIQLISEAIQKIK